MASPARVGASGPPSGEKTVAATGLMIEPGALLVVVVVVGFKPSCSPLSPPPTSPKIRPRKDASTISATSSTAAPAPIPISRLRRRRACAAAGSNGFARLRGARGGAASTGSIRSVRSEAAVACCSRCNSVGAVLIPPLGCTALMAAAEIWNGMASLTAQGSIGSPDGPVLAGRNPLGAPVSGSGQRSTRSAYSAAPTPRTSAAGVASASVAGKASATSPSRLTRTRPG